MTNADTANSNAGELSHHGEYQHSGSTEKTLPTAQDWRSAFQAAVDQLPETAPKTQELLLEEQRLTDFRRICDHAFIVKLDRTKLKNADAFDAIAYKWDGAFPGPLALGPTGAAKTRAAWVALGRLYVRQSKPFAWFPVRKLITEMERYESLNAADEFFRMFDHYRVLFVDDVDKINWQFSSQQALLFSFYDWIYRRQKPCITTTNQTRQWWTAKMGDAFARRLFEDAHFGVNFDLRTNAGASASPAV